MKKRKEGNTWKESEMEKRNACDAWKRTMMKKKAGRQALKQMKEIARYEEWTETVRI
jgi:hypothetical protein